MGDQTRHRQVIRDEGTELSTAISNGPMGSIEVC
jgi:hypothetical protein